MTKPFEGRVALVTGSVRGIGAATLDHMAEGGADVVVCDLDGDAARATAATIAERHGRRALGVACDVSRTEDVDGMVDTVVRELGRLDILVNNAGLTRDNLIHKMSDDDWDRVISVHLRGAFLCARAAQRVMVPQKYGRIVNVSSTSALGNRGQLNYSTAKAGLQGFTRTLALELGRFGITVNAVAPGFIDTEMTQQTARRLGFEPDDYKAQRAKNIAVGRVGVPQDVAATIAFLASEAASFVNGQIIYVSGGPETRR
ncbi:3-oxoacyl-ACP reductase FabG [Azospirillum sp. RWY-5-1]|uniref:3-oxoacyl-ACP reductase FabG n=1 Tax=Azospirillum oleiclasticum TaxID=2735135 RepID=A0ABX2TLN4_9PROT|nr:3-oxoacyl-ACP reductase FabG [Azospirillum oleiclasticum]NYZ23988.1 3-oxoacyl-ACP reductase FabG [Azospirillum oleiclasticum]